jgi:hypothetical protein
MKRTRVVLICLALAATAIAAAATSLLRAGVQAVERMRDFGAWVLRGCSSVAVEPGMQPLEGRAETPIVAFVRALAYRLRQIKRARPEVHPCWRLCPST